MDHYSKEIYIAKVDKHDNILGKIERWEAHRKGILHRAFSVVILYEDQFVIQHRKHPVFDDVFDISVSSHQMYVGDKLEEDLPPIYSTLEREFNITKTDLVGEPKFDGKVYYQADDPRSEFKEHEVCRFYTCQVKKIPTPNYDFAYGTIVMPKDKLKNSAIYPALAPWIHTAIDQDLL